MLPLLCMRTLISAREWNVLSVSIRSEVEFSFFFALLWVPHLESSDNCADLGGEQSPHLTFGPTNTIGRTDSGEVLDHLASFFLFFPGSPLHLTLFNPIRTTEVHSHHLSVLYGSRRVPSAILLPGTDPESNMGGGFWLHSRAHPLRQNGVRKDGMAHGDGLTGMGWHRR